MKVMKIITLLFVFFSINVISAQTLNLSKESVLTTENQEIVLNVEARPFSLLTYSNDAKNMEIIQEIQSDIPSFEMQVSALPFSMSSPSNKSIENMESTNGMMQHVITIELNAVQVK
jgi:hypothetical protein